MEDSSRGLFDFNPHSLGARPWDEVKIPPHPNPLPPGEREINAGTNADSVFDSHQQLSPGLMLARNLER